MSLHIGVQLYSVREALHQDPTGTLEKVAAAGYRRWEAANSKADVDPGIGLGMSAGEVKELMARLGASIIGAHVRPFDENNCRARSEERRVG